MSGTDRKTEMQSSITELGSCQMDYLVYSVEMVFRRAELPLGATLIKYFCLRFLTEMAEMLDLQTAVCLAVSEVKAMVVFAPALEGSKEASITVKY